MSVEHKRHKIPNPLSITLLRRTRSESVAPHHSVSEPKDPFKKTRKARPGTASAFSHLHDGFNEAGKQLAEQHPLPFSEILQMLLPPKMVTAKSSSDPPVIMEKLKKIGKTSWFVFKHVLKVVQAASVLCPQLQNALEALILVLDQLEIMKDARDGFFEVSSKLSALQFILFRHRFSPDEQAQERLTSFAEWARSVRVYIENNTKQNAMVRFFTASDNHDAAVKLLQSLGSVIDFFMLDVTLNIEDQMKRLQMKVEDIDDHLQLGGLNHVVQAGWITQKDDKCLTGTRCIVMSDLMDWCRDPNQPRVFWLSGMAGTGKSAIARTLCDKLSSARLLGGSFFCSRRGSAEQRDITRVIPTLTRHLARLDGEYRKNVVECLRRDSDISNATIDKQLEELLIKPCSESLRALSTPLILVIDALDEGAEADDTARLLEAILSKAEMMPFRFFVTSRPESHIREKFASPASRKRIQTQILRLHDIEGTMVKADIHLYVQHRLVKIKEEPSVQIPKEWPTDDQIQKLADRADKLFIYAFTACNYIKRDPLDRLNIIIQTTVSDERPLMERLDDMYTLILDEAKNPKTAGPGIISDIEKCLTALVYVQETLSVIGLATLMETEPRRIRTVMNDLHSLILVPETSDDGPVTTLHASLGDYLNDEQRSKQHVINKEAGNWILLRRCLQVLSQELHFNISESTTSFLTNDQQRLKLPHTLVYSAANWARHMTEISPSEELLTTVITWVKSTLIPKFLFWIEVMSVGKKMGDVPGMLWTLQRFVEERAEPDVIKFLHDAFLFVHMSREAIQRSAPHIYLSALAFCQEESCIKKEFEHEYAGIPLACWNGMERSKLIFCIGKVGGEEGMIDLLQGQVMSVGGGQAGSAKINPPDMHTDSVWSVAFSPDGKYIASGSRDKTVCMWDAQTGQLTMKPFEGHSSDVWSVGFSPDGKQIVSGSSDKTVRLWDVQTGRSIIKPFRGHTNLVLSVGFSPDGKYIVSGSHDKTVRVWDAKTGRRTIKPLEGHTHCVWSVGFSPDGKYIVSGSSDKTVRVWDAQTGQPTMNPFRGHTSHVYSVAFSPDGKYIVSGSIDNTVRVWNTQTGRPMMKPLQGHTSYVNSVGFLSDGKYIVSGSSDKTVRVWNAQTGQPAMKPFQGHIDSVRSVGFSPDGNYIVSSSYDKTVRVWNARACQVQPIMKPFQGYTNSVQSVEISPDATYIASGSFDNTLCAWDAQTPYKEAPDTTQAIPTLPPCDDPIHHTVSTVPVDSTPASPAVIGSLSFSPYTHHGFPLSNDLFPLPITDPTGDLRDIFTVYPKNSGWILGPNDELFLWVPADVRFSIWLPWTTGPPSKGKIYLDLSGYSCGPRWVNCRRPLIQKGMSSSVINVAHIEYYAAVLDDNAAMTRSP